MAPERPAFARSTFGHGVASRASENPCPQGSTCKTCDDVLSARAVGRDRRLLSQSAMGSSLTAQPLRQ
jgi:hypothetical protein